MAATACPGCAATMEAEDHEGLFTCAGCGGSYLERRALEAARIVVPVELARHAPRRPRRCAGCEGPMSTLTVRGVTLDRCDPCGSLYFDAGELDAVRAGKDDGDSLECDGCGQRVPIADLESRDGKALCSSCVEQDPRNRATGLSARDFGRAQQHATQAQLDQERADQMYARRRWGFYDYDSGPGLLDALMALFR